MSFPQFYRKLATRGSQQQQCVRVKTDSTDLKLRCRGSLPEYWMLFKVVKMSWKNLCGDKSDNYSQVKMFLIS